MALETWLVKVKSAISNTLDTSKSTTPPNTKTMVLKKKSNNNNNVGILAFEIAGLMSKLLHLWQSLSDNNMIRLRNESIFLEGVRKIVSNDDAFLLGLACAEMTENLRLVAKTVSRISNRCDDHSSNNNNNNNNNLRCFYRFLDEFANSGKDGHSWVLSFKDMEMKKKKMDRYVTVTATLHREMEELAVTENSLKKLLQLNEHLACIKDQQKIIDLQQKISWQKCEVEYLKKRSLWCRTFDTVASLLVRSTFTVLARIKLVFGIAGGHGYPTSLPRCLSASATVYPSENHTTTTSSSSSSSFISGPLKPEDSRTFDDSSNRRHGNFFESNSKLLKQPPSSTLGASALALHYANLIIVMEKMIKSPQLVGIDARDDLYAMLPKSIRSSLRSRLRGVGFFASDPVLAGEWREALGRILGWLSPLAHNMIKWQSERSFEQQQNLVPKRNGVLLLFQTLYFANKEKAEAAITELLVGLNYIWRFEREMNAKALFDNGFFNNLQNPTSSE